MKETLSLNTDNFFSVIFCFWMGQIFQNCSSWIILNKLSTNQFFVNYNVLFAAFYCQFSKNQQLQSKLSEC